MTEPLSTLLASIQEDLAARSTPYKHAADLREQRDSARRWAVDYEQTAAEMSRRVYIALAYAGEWDCDRQAHADGLSDCRRCTLESILAGDE